MGGRGRKDFQNKLMELSNKIRQHIREEDVKEMESDGGIDLNELKTVLAQNDLETSPMIIDKFKELDTNENGFLEKSEVGSEGEGEDYGLATTLLGAVVSGFVIAVVSSALGD